MGKVVQHILVFWSQQGGAASLICGKNVQIFSIYQVLGPPDFKAWVTFFLRLIRLKVLKMSSGMANK